MVVRDRIPAILERKVIVHSFVSLDILCTKRQQVDDKRTVNAG